MPKRKIDPLEEILDKIREARNFDFRNYKRPTLRRRIERRMQERRCASMDEYAELLDRSPEEYDALVSGMLVKVTSFFRDTETWDLLQRTVIPAVVNRRRGEEIRVWSVGCATGEETYSVAMLLADALGPTAAAGSVKVFGTDADEAAIAFARRGIYPHDAVEELPRDVVQRHFVSTAEGWTVRKEIRRMVVFGTNNLVSDAPISRLDLLLCRNVFIYLDAPLQSRVLTRFHYALRPQGVLVLGRSELIPFAAKLFEPVDLHRRIYRRRVMESAAEERGLFLGASERKLEERADLPRLERAALQVMRAPVIATTFDGVVTLWNPAAERLWGRTSAQVLHKRITTLGLPGLPGDLLVEKSAQVRGGAVDRAAAEGVIEVPGGASATVSVEVTATRDGGSMTGLLYVVNDVTALRASELEHARAREERDKALEDLQTVSEEMQSSNEELETTNEELQSANEELQTTNEELQSTNEELETTNEELQSTNAELDSTNRELARRTEELGVLSVYQRTIIRSLSAGVAVLDPEGKVMIWNLAAERLLGLTETEAVGQTFWNLRMPIISRTLAREIRKKLGARLAFRVDDLDYERSGRQVGHAVLSALPLVDGDRYLGGLVLLEDTTRAVALAEERIRERQKARPARAASGGQVARRARPPRKASRTARRA